MAAGRMACANHVGADARFYCAPCELYLCVDCSKHTWAQDGFIDQCRKCDALLEPLAAPRPGGRAAHDRPDRGGMAFVERLPQMLAYPFQTNALLTLAGLTLLVMFLRWVPMIGWVIAWGLELSLFFHIITTTANGVYEFDAPSFDNAWDDILAPVGRGIVAFSPIIAAVVVAGAQVLQGEVGDPLPAVLFWGGAILLPLLLAVAAMGSSAFSILNPVLWGESIGIMGTTYLAGSIAFYVIAAAHMFVLQPALASLATAIPSGFAASATTIFLGYFPMVWAARVIGGMCEPYIGEVD